MKKTKKLMICSIGCLVWNGTAFAQNPTKDISDGQKSFDNSDCLVLPNGVHSLPRNCQKLYKAPDGRLKPPGYVALLRVENGTGVLNPTAKNFPYRHKLNRLSLKDVERLWGQPKETMNSDIRAFELWTTGDRHVFRIETRFKNGRLHEYKVTGPGLDCSQWKQAD